MTGEMVKLMLLGAQTMEYRGAEEKAELERLRSTLGLSREQVQSMTYKQLAKALDDRLSVTPSCGGADLYDAAVLLLPPLLNKQSLRRTGPRPWGSPFSRPVRWRSV